MPDPTDTAALIGRIPPALPVLIAGPTASGKSALALRIVREHGGVIVNADALQVYACWRVITARPTVQEEAETPHRLYGHVAAADAYSAGHWLRDVQSLLKGPLRPIIVGGTGLYFAALTEGLAEIPATPAAVRAHADTLPAERLLADLDKATLRRIDTANRARVQRAWEVLTATGRSLADWQDDTGPALLPSEGCFRIAFDVGRDWLNDRIARRFDLMLAMGALNEVAAVRPVYDPALPGHRAIGVPELMAHLEGRISLDAARTAAIVASRRYGKRQRTWMRSRMQDWHRIQPDE